MAKGEAGRHAVTHYEVLETFANGGAAPSRSCGSSWRPGRTHQIRVHLAHIGHPGARRSRSTRSGFKAKAAKLHRAAREALAALGRQALHAAELGFEHPRHGKKLHFASPLPGDMRDAARPPWPVALAESPQIAASIR